MEIDPILESMPVTTAERSKKVLERLRHEPYIWFIAPTRTADIQAYIKDQNGEGVDRVPGVWVWRDQSYRPGCDVVAGRFKGFHKDGDREYLKFSPDVDGEVIEETYMIDTQVIDDGTVALFEFKE